MTKFDQAMHLAAVCVALLILAPPSMAQGKEVAATAPAAAPKKAHRLVLQVNTNEPATMTLALNNAINVEQHYKEPRREDRD